MAEMKVERKGYEHLKKVPGQALMKSFKKFKNGKDLFYCNKGIKLTGGVVDMLKGLGQSSVDGILSGALMGMGFDGDEFQLKKKVMTIYIHGDFSDSEKRDCEKNCANIPIAVVYRLCNTHGYKIYEAKPSANNGGHGQGGNQIYHIKLKY
eukprot:109274_1